MKKIRKNARKKLIWTASEMQDYILRNTGTKYSIAHVRYLLRKMGLHPKRFRSGARKRASAEEIYTFQKETADVIKKRREGNSHRNTGRIHSGCRARARKRGYTRRGVRASYVYTGSYSKTDSVRDCLPPTAGGCSDSTAGLTCTPLPGSSGPQYAGLGGSA